MAVPQLVENMPSYIIYRDIQPGEPFDPTSNLLFFPEKGSDELFDALRIAFPHLKTHSERMRQAVIQFLLEEREAESSLETSPAMTMDSTWPSMSTGGAPSVWSSPDMNNLSTPASFAPSPRNQATQLTRQASTPTSVSQPSPPAIDQMTSVFSLSTSAQPKQRIRRKMTEAEKIEYRKRRIVKACDKCAKRKRKCPHNQAQMETVVSTSDKSSARISKSTSPKSSKSPPAAPPPQQHASFDLSGLYAEDVNFSESFEFDSFVPTEDFDLFQDPFADLNMDSFEPYDQFTSLSDFQASDLFTPDLSPTQQDSQYLESHNFNQADQTLPQHYQLDQTAWEEEFSSCPGLYSSSGLIGRSAPLSSDCTTQLDVRASDSMMSSLESFSSVNGQQGRSEIGISPQLTGRNISRSTEVLHTADILQGVASLQSTGQTISQSNQFGQSNLTANPAVSGRSKNCGVDRLNGSGQDLWEHVSAGQPEKPVPTHTRHVHEADSIAESGSTECVIRPQDTAKRHSLSRTVLRLTGTKKAVVTFTGMVSKRPSSTPAVSLARVVEAIQLDVPPSHRVGGSLHQSRPDQVASVQSIKTSEPSASREKSGSRSNMRVLPHGQELAPTSVSASGRIPSAALQGRPISSMDERPLAQQTVNNQHKPCDHGTRSLGQGLSEHANPSAQLYMARKRVMTGLSTNTRLQTWLVHGQDASVYVDASVKQRAIVAANGGAYPRLDDSNLSLSASLALQTIHTASGSSDNTDCQDHADLQDLTDIHGDNANRETQEHVHEHRLRDTNRYKDHHGRASLSSYLLTMFGCALLLRAASLLFPTLSGTAILLALVIPCQEPSSSSSSSSLSSPWTSIVRCTTKNSRWLSSAFTSRNEIKYGLSVPSRKRPGWFHRNGEEAWL